MTKFHENSPNGNNVEATFDFVDRIVRLVAFDNVASTLLLVWTGLKTVEPLIALRLPNIAGSRIKCGCRRK